MLPSFGQFFLNPGVCSKGNIDACSAVIKSCNRNLKLIINVLGKPGSKWMFHLDKEVVAMGHIIEEAKSGRASCRSCKQPIAKGELRLGEEVPNAFAEGEMTFRWHHLPCGAQKKPSALKQALESTDVEVPNKEELLKTIGSSAKSEKPTTFPYAELAPTSRSSCISCGEKIEKGDLRIAVETELDAGGFMRKGAGYLHPGCAPEHTEEEADELFAKVRPNSVSLNTSDLESLEEQLLEV